MPPSIDTFYRAAEAYAAARKAEARLVILTRELRQLEAQVAASQEIIDAFIGSQPGGKRMLDEHFNFLRRSGFLEGLPPAAAKRASPSQVRSRARSRPARTAAATQAAAAKRKAFRELNPDVHISRSLGQRLALFSDGFVQGYRDRVEDPSPAKRYAKGDRSRGWIAGASAAAGDLAIGVVVDISRDLIPPAVLDEYTNFLRARGVAPEPAETPVG